MSDHEDYEDADRAAELAAIRSRAEREQYEYSERQEDSGHLAVWVECAECEDGFYLVEPSEGQRAALRELMQAQQDRRALLARLDEVETERDAIAQAAEAAVTALNAAVQRLGQQRDDAHAQMKAACDYLERLPSRTPERERLINAIVAQLGPEAHHA